MHSKLLVPLKSAVAALSNGDIFLLPGLSGALATRLDYFESFSQGCGSGAGV